jgi:L-rhamnose-H+ transport protein
LGVNPFIGVVYHWLGGLASASCYLPFRGIKRWSWEVYWLVQGTFSWIFAPIFMASLLVPEVPAILHAAPTSSIFWAYFWGCMWGFGGLTCGLAVRYLGFALAYPLVLGLCTLFGTLMPPIFSGEIGAIARSSSGQVILLGLGVCVIGILFSGFAGRSKEKELTEEQKQASVSEFRYGRGVSVSVLSGIMSACFAYGLSAGKPIAALAKSSLLSHNRIDLWQNLPVLIVVMLGGFTTNFLWCIILLVRNRSARQYLGFPADPGESSSTFRLHAKTLFANYGWAALAGITWYFQFFFYSMGETKMGKYTFSSWTLHMASIMIFAMLIGIMLHEWRGTSVRTRTLVAAGLFFLLGSTVVVGYGNYIKANQPATTVETVSMTR